MQLDPIKLALKAPGTKRLKRRSDETLLSFAFKINLRCYNMGDVVVSCPDAGGGRTFGLNVTMWEWQIADGIKVAPCRLKP